jgi:hypothetical protein
VFCVFLKNFGSHTLNIIKRLRIFMYKFLKQLFYIIWDLRWAQRISFPKIKHENVGESLNETFSWENFQFFKKGAKNLFQLHFCGSCKKISSPQVQFFYNFYMFIRLFLIWVFGLRKIYTNQIFYTFFSQFTISLHILFALK